MLCSLCSKCEKDTCDIKIKVLMYYSYLGELLVAEHKTLYAMCCRQLCRELTALGVKIEFTKSEELSYDNN